MLRSFVCYNMWVMKIKIFAAALLLGFTSLLAQTLLIREFLISFYGNELIIGVVLANWIILAAIGSIYASRLSLKNSRPILIYAILQTGISLYLPIGVLLIRLIKNILGLSLGEGMAILPTLTTSFFILAPLTILVGAQFPFACRILSDFSKRPLQAVGRIYVVEAMGFILAGPLITYLVISKLNAFQIAFLAGLLNISCAILLLKTELKDNLRKIFIATLGLLLILLIFIFFAFSQKIHSFSVNKQWMNQRVLDYRNSVYGNLVVTKTKGQYTFYSDGLPIITTPFPDIASLEELAHFVALSHKNPKDILFLSGAAGGLIKEVLKHPLKKLDYAELDPALIQLLKKFPTALTQEELNSPYLNIKFIDGRRFVRLANYRYDVIILNLPASSTLQLNRFFTQEFFRNIKSILNDEGIFALRLPGSLSYIGEELRNLNGSIWNTLKTVFPVVKIIPGDYNLYISSKSNFEISPQIFISRLKERNIPTHLLSDSYLQYRLDPRWITWFTASMKDTTKIRDNSDLLPSGLFYGISYWNAQFSRNLESFFRSLDRLNFKLLLSIICLAGVGFFLCQRAFPKLKRASIGFAISSTGFTGMSVNLMIIFAYQSFYGFIFQHFALLVTAFMAGISLGSWLMTRKMLNIKNDVVFFSKIEAGLIAFCLGLGPLLIYLDKSPLEKLAFLFFILSALCGLLVGAEFPLANKIYRQNKENYTQAAGMLYGLDLIGSWLATLLVSIALIPVIGILKTCILLVAIKIISLSFVRNLAN